ncbi:MAG: HAD family hydrolase [Bdellovibrio sp.]|nr:MAG: HAD family hydrolase [Bdellovibrio sp.]
MPHSIKVHKNILQAAKESTSLLVVFDLDSTLFDVSPRSQKILQDCSQDSEFQALFPEEWPLLHKVQVRPTDWGIRESLLRSPIKAHLSFFEHVQKFWKKHFFSDTYLHLDRPYPGAVPFVQSIYNAGAHIIYLTGRYQTRMMHGTVQSLKKHGFPLEENMENLIMKPSESEKDETYKVEVLKTLEKQYSRIWFFENEPVIIQHTLRQCPSINIVFMDTVHSGRTTPPENLLRIQKQFRLHSTDNEF